MVKQHHADPNFENRLLLLEHPPTYTVGKRGAIYDETFEEYLRELGADFYRVNRGGLITFHGPGQLVGYGFIALFYPKIFNGRNFYVSWNEANFFSGLLYIGMLQINIFVQKINQ